MDQHRARVIEVLGIFLRLGTTAFGGPAVHIALMREEFVERRKWLSEQQFLDLLGATNLIPGPNSTEMAIHLGYQRAGLTGLLAGGAGFIVPSMLIVLGMAWAYVRFGQTPQVAWLMYGIKPVVIAIILNALWNLGKSALKGWLLTAAAAAVLLLYLFGLNELLLLFGAGLLVMLLRGVIRLRGGSARPGWLLPGIGAGGLAGAVLSAPVPFSLSVLFLTFLKIGSVLYGSGYVLLAFMRSDFVQRLGWLTEAQLIEAIAIGQVTPGPVSSTATFVGYLLGGLPGALLATAGIFLPAFVFVGITHPLVPRLRQSAWASALLDGVNAASLGLMAGVTIQLGRAALVDPLAVLLALVSALLLFRFKINSTWLILGGGLIGLARFLVG